MTRPASPSQVAGAEKTTLDSASLSPTPAVRFETRPARGGRRIALAWLNRPERLNALDLEMCELLLAQMTEWSHQADIAAVVLAGEGPKGFCAGGDVRQAVQDIRSGGADRFAYGDQFFTVEYQLDLLLHTFPKPLVTWAHGVTMGGGLGLSVAGSHRIVTSGAKMAMPEIHIGLFPDVGGGWFLNRVPGEAGLLMALTGVMLNEQDVVYARLADYILDHALQAHFLEALCSIEWGETAPVHRRQATDFCLGFESAHPSPTNVCALRDRHAQVRAICMHTTLDGLLQALRQAAASDRWFEGPLANLEKGSPTAAAVTLEYLRRSRLLGLAQVLDLDLVIAKQCLRNPDFPEGVRALLLDKDKSPRWSPATVAEVTPALAERFFQPLE